MKKKAKVEKVNASALELAMTSQLELSRQLATIRGDRFVALARAEEAEYKLAVVNLILAGNQPEAIKLFLKGSPAKSSFVSDSSWVCNVELGKDKGAKAATYVASWQPAVTTADGTNTYEVAYAK